MQFSLALTWNRTSCLGCFYLYYFLFRGIEVRTERRLLSPHAIYINMDRDCGLVPALLGTSGSVSVWSSVLYRTPGGGPKICHITQAKLKVHSVLMLSCAATEYSYSRLP